MREHWESVIENELDFLYYAPKYEAEINELLIENELDIQLPVTRFDEEQGRIYIHCPGTEVQALRRIEREEALTKGLERLSKRTDRMWNALSQLSEEDRDLIIWVYIERDGTPERYIASSSGFRTIAEYQKAKKNILLKLLKIYEDERKDLHLEWRETLKKERQKQADLLRKYLKEA